MNIVSIIKKFIYVAVFWVSLVFVFGVSIGDVVDIFTTYLLRWDQIQLTSLFTLILSGILLFNHWRHQDAPLTIKSSSITIEYVDSNGEEVSISTINEIQANRSDVDTYFTYHNAHQGSVTSTDFESSISGPDYNPNIEHIIHPNGNSGIEIITRSNRPIPKAGLLGKKYFYTGKVKYLNAFTNSHRESYKIMFDKKYRYNKIEFILHLPQEKCNANCELQLFSGHSLKSYPVQRTVGANGTCEYRITKNPRRHNADSARLVWTFS